MVAEFIEYENENGNTVYQKTDTKPRDIDTLYTLDRSEMTDEEFETLVQYEADKVIQAEEFKRQNEAIVQDLETKKEIYQQEAANARNLLDMLTAHAIENFKNAV